MGRAFLTALILTLMAGCQPGSKKNKAEEKPVFKASFQSNAKGVVSLHTFDHYTRPIDNAYGFYIGPNLVVCNLSFIKGAYKVKSSPMGLEDFSSVAGYLAYDLNLDLVLLKVTRKNKNYLKLNEAEQKPDSVYRLFRKERKLFADPSRIKKGEYNDSLSFDWVNDQFKSGQAVFSKNHRLAGICQASDPKRMLHARWIKQLLKNKTNQPRSIYELRDKSNKVYPPYTSIKEFKIITNKGNIHIALSNKTPKYRDNFIKLVSDQFYDSLLVHRVINDYLIQTGASDTKYAKKDDVVGWQGPGYTLPMHIIPELFHQRGMIAASKLPADRNKHNRSDGSQFYIIAGRVFSDKELDEIEKEGRKKFSQKQREIYTTIGGAPYLDGDYTVFARVTKGMDIVDKIAASETYAIDRPIEEIRIKTIEIIKK